MPQANQGQGPVVQTTQSRNFWKGLIVAVIIGGSVLTGVGLARSNSDIICSRTFEDSGACTSGAWGAWSITSQNADQNACSTSVVEKRTYTGLRNTISSLISVSVNAHTYCRLSDDAFQRGSGTITSRFSACQIEETRTRKVTGSGAGATCKLPTVDTKTATGTIVSDLNTEINGAVDEAKTQTVTGTYQQYLDLIDARLASSTLRVAPAIVRTGDTTHVSWSSTHVKSCTVVGSNGDGWNTLESVAGGEVSKAITSQTIYTLTCLTALGNSLTQQAIVNLVPEFQEN